MSDTMSDTMLSVENLSAWYGAARILYDLNFNVGRGEVVALMGRNGAGKSTTMKTIMGLIAERQGAVKFNGHDISRLKRRAVFRMARRRRPGRRKNCSSFFPISARCRTGSATA